MSPSTARREKTIGDVVISAAIFSAVSCEVEKDVVDFDMSN